MLRALLVILTAIVAIVIAVNLSPVDDPGDFVQGECSGPDWYADPSLVAHRLDCARMERFSTHQP